MENLAYIDMVCSVLNNFEETDQMEDKEGAEDENNM